MGKIQESKYRQASNFFRHFFVLKARQSKMEKVLFVLLILTVCAIFYSITTDLGSTYFRPTGMEVMEESRTEELQGTAQNRTEAKEEDQKPKEAQPDPNQPQDREDTSAEEEPEPDNTPIACKNFNPDLEDTQEIQYLTIGDRRPRKHQQCNQEPWVYFKDDKIYIDQEKYGPMTCTFEGQKISQWPSTELADPVGLFADDAYPLLWDEFRRYGYVTAFQEEQSTTTGVFNHLGRGFRYRPTDHYARPFHIQRDALGIHQTGCYMNITSNMLGMIDGEFRAFLKWLQDSETLENTILIIFGDYGKKAGSKSNTHQGRNEERRPLMYIKLPQWFRESNPVIVRNLEKNSELLTTPLDIAKTLKDILVLKKINFAKRQSRKKQALNLFRPVPRTRTCADAGIDPKWCPCTDWTVLDTTSDFAQQTARKVVEFINDYVLKQLKNYKKESLPSETCVTLALDTVSQFIKLQGTAADGLNKEKPRGNETEYFELFFTTIPGGAKFEATVKIIAGSTSPEINAKVNYSN
ncbi:unnamed protein product [Notodromas monacha]|uniref:Uncharacterized protein n=1 Tax=Notodromas monacha TaxID=399045 RepID=A0A7R9BFD3_9CRUS|nr:unnamed protein product [Notodromas monacha]CAG0912806.1 unnamed protein product [Notodromas monacha]